MRLVNVAMADLSGVPGAVASAWRWAVHHPLVVLPIVVVWAMYTVWAYRWSKRQPHQPQPEKATLRGTAQVLSFKQTKGMDWDSAMDVELHGKRDLLGRKRKATFNYRYWCNIKLAVHIPGREEYVIVVRQPLGPQERAVVQRGRTVVVWIDPEGEQKDVLIDFNQPIM